MAAIKLETDEAIRVVTACKTWTDETEVNFFNPIISRIRDCGFQGDELKKIEEVADALAETFKAIKADVDVATENFKNVVLDFTDMTADQFQKALVDSAQNAKTAGGSVQERPRRD